MFDVSVIESVLKKVNATAKNPQLAAVNVKSFIEKPGHDRLKEANNIIVDLGGKEVDKVYDARMIAQSMIVDAIKAGKVFDCKTSFDNGKWRAKKQREQWPSLASNEDNYMTEKAVTTASTSASTSTPGTGVKIPKVKAIKAAKEPKAEKGPTILKNGKERGSMRAVALGVYEKFKDTEQLVPEMCKALGVEKSGAYTHIYLVKQAILKAAAKTSHRTAQ